MVESLEIHGGERGGRREGESPFTILRRKRAW
jgi:hypothetical protein